MTNIIKHRGIALNMLYGLESNNQPDQEVLSEFEKKFNDKIDWVISHMPTKISTGVLGAICKAVVWYGEEKLEPFCDAFKKHQFNGLGDPAHFLFVWLNSRAKYTNRDAYAKTVTAIRLYMANKQLSKAAKYTLHKSKTDLFKWNEDFTIAKMRANNNAKTLIKELV